MKLRPEIEPDFETAEKFYPEVLKLFLAYTDFCEENGNEDFIEYKKLEHKLHELTGKDMSQFNLWEWWEEEGAEVLAFRIALPDEFSGEWYNKKQKRNLIISYDTENNSFIINDHTKSYSEDAYNAYPKNNKLILPAQNSDHHSSYCEISIINNQLIYECNSALNFKDNYLKGDKFSTKMVFKKRKK